MQLKNVLDVLKRGSTLTHADTCCPQTQMPECRAMADVLARPTGRQRVRRCRRYCGAAHTPPVEAQYIYCTHACTCVCFRDDGWSTKSIQHFIRDNAASERFPLELRSWHFCLARHEVYALETITYVFYANA